MSRDCCSFMLEGGSPVALQMFMIVASSTELAAMRCGQIPDSKRLRCAITATAKCSKLRQKTPIVCSHSPFRAHGIGND